MAGSKSLNVYSLEEASNHFKSALALLDESPDCATDEQVTDFLVSYSRLLHFMAQVNKLLHVHELHGSRLLQLGDDQRVVIARSILVIGLVLNNRFRDAANLIPKVSLMAGRLGILHHELMHIFTELSVRVARPRSASRGQIPPQRDEMATASVCSSPSARTDGVTCLVLRCNEACPGEQVLTFQIRLRRHF